MKICDLSPQNQSKILIKSKRLYIVLIIKEIGDRCIDTNSWNLQTPMCACLPAFLAGVLWYRQRRNRAQAECTRDTQEHRWHQILIFKDIQSDPVTSVNEGTEDLAGVILTGF